MPFNMFGEDQSGWMPDNSAIGQFSMPIVDPYQQAASQLIVEKKKKKWLDEMADRLAGDRYYGTNDVDRRRATARAMIELSKQFTEAAGKGSWGAFASATASALPTISSAFDKNMSEFQQQRELNRNQAYTDQKRALDLENSQTALESNKITLQNQKDKQAVDARAEESTPSIIEEFDRTFNDVVKKSDITDGQRKSAAARWQALATMAANDPSNPQRVADMANFIVELGGDSDVSEQAAKKFNITLQQEAAKNGMTVEEFVKNNRISINRKITQDDLGIKLTRSAIAENEAQTKVAQEAASAMDGGVPKAYVTSYRAVNQSLKDLEKDDEFFDTIEAVMSGSPIQTLSSSTRAKLKMYGITDLNSAKDFLSNFMPQNRDAYIKKLIGLGGVNPADTGGVAFDINDPVQINNFLNSLSPEERAMMRGPQ